MVLRARGWRIEIFPNDHEPEDVHVFKTRGKELSAKYDLNCPNGRVSIISIGHSISAAELRQLEAVLNAHIDLLCDEWDRLHP